MKDDEIIKLWVNNLTKEELRQALIDFLNYVQSGEDYRFGTTGNPYWICTGEPVVNGQVCFEDD